MFSLTQPLLLPCYSLHLSLPWPMQARLGEPACCWMMWLVVALVLWLLLGVCVLQLWLWAALHAVRAVSLPHCSALLPSPSHPGASSTSCCWLQARPTAAEVHARAAASGQTSIRQACWQLQAVGLRLTGTPCSPSGGVQLLQLSFQRCIASLQRDGCNGQGLRP